MKEYPYMKSAVVLLYDYSQGSQGISAPYTLTLPARFSVLYLCDRKIRKNPNPFPIWKIGFGLYKFGASGDTELFEKASNINGFQGGRVANNLYISPFWATVFQTAALFLYPNSSAVIWVENLRFLSLWLAF